MEGTNGGDKRQVVTGWRMVQAKRAARLLLAARCVTTWYAVAAIDAGLVDNDELRGGRNGRNRRRWCLA